MVPASAINLWVAVTDWDWFHFLRVRPHLTEINFWQPGGRTAFHVLQPGGLFLFKLHFPRNFIVGGGIFAHDSNYPASLAWEAFGEANGAVSLEEMRARIVKYRRGNGQDRTDFHIGCRIISRPFFFPEEQWIDTPSSWSRNIVQGKSFSTADSEGLKLWEQVQSRLSSHQGFAAAESQPRYGPPVPVPPRLGQGGFRLMVTDAYGRRCAITGENVLPALEAGHIRPYAQEGEHSIDNGLLLRRDFHGLFDRGYITVTPEHRLEVSKRIREEFVNGKRYYDMQGRLICTPSSPGLKPRADYLRWHNEHVFIG